MKLIELDLPEYQVDKEPDHKTIGKRVDDVIKQYYRAVAVGPVCSERAEKRI